LAASALLHLDEPRAHALLDDGSSNDKTDEWCIDTGATHHMTGRWEFFTELDSDARGSVKFGDAFGVEIKGVGSVIFTAESGEHRLLTGVYYIPTLRKLYHRLLAKVTRGTNRLCILNVKVTQPLYLTARRDNEAW
jgi:hypothetical protein